MTKFNALTDLTGKGGGVPAAGGGFFKDLNNSIMAFRDVLKLAKELRDGATPPAGHPAIDRLPSYPEPKSLPAAPNPALGKFLAEYGDTTVNEALKVIGPMTIKQLLAMVQHGTRPGK